MASGLTNFAISPVTAQSISELAPTEVAEFSFHQQDFIADEVQTAFGRTGDHYWGFENWGVTPDIVTMAKGIGNGIPLGACVTRPEIASEIGATG